MGAGCSRAAGFRHFQPAELPALRGVGGENLVEAVGRCEAESLTLEQSTFFRDVFCLAGVDIHSSFNIHRGHEKA